MTTKDEIIVLDKLENVDDILKPSKYIENALADIKKTYQTSLIEKIPFTEIAALGGAFSNVVCTLATPTGQGIYRCVFPNGVTGTLAMAKDGSGALGTIMNSSGIVGQARWIPVENAVGPAVLEATLVAVAVLAVVKELEDIKTGQKEIIQILERDKKSQLLADYDILSDYMQDYKFYWENPTTVTVNLNQVANIKRNALKDIRSYVEQIEGIITAKNNILKFQTSSQQIGGILDRFVHYKLALHVFALAQYMEMMLAKNFQMEYLNKVEEEIREYDFQFRNLYTACFDKIELLKKDALSTQVAKNVANVSKNLGGLIGKIPVVKDGPIDEFLADIGDSITENEKVQLEKTLSFFMRYKESGLIPIAERIATINAVSNRPMAIVSDNNLIQFHELKRVV